MKFYLLLCFYLSMACCAFAQAPVITGDTMLCPNGTGTATVTGSTAYTSYQWQVKPYGETSFTNVGGATSASFTYDTYNYSVTTIRVAVTQGAQSYTSNELFIDGMAFLGIYYMTETAGNVTFNPNTEGYVICNGGTITNTVGMPYSLVQWYKDGAAIAGATSTSYTITQAGTYYAVAAPAACPNYTQTTLPCVVSVCSTPGIVAPVIDGDVLLCPNTDGTATITNGQVYDTYQWQVKLYGEDEFTNIPGATSASFSYPVYDYAVTTIRLVVTEDGDTYTSNELFIDGYAWAGLTIMHEYDPTLVTIGENGQLLLCGDATVTNTVGMPYTVVQWYKDGEPITGATSPNYVISAPGEYYVVAAPGFCPQSTSMSIPFTVEENTNCDTPVVVAPVIDGDVMLCPDTEGTATVTNNQTYDTYQWQVQLFGEETFNDIEGATAASFTYGAYDYSATTLRLVVTADGETYTSNELFVDGYAWAGLSIMHDFDPTEVTVDMDNGNFLLCGDTTITNTVGMPYSIVQWFKDGEAIAGATATTYVITGPGEYYVVAAPGYCPASTSTSIPFVVENNPDCTAGTSNPNTALFTLYPNPASTAINISITDAAKANAYIIYDVTGKTLLQGSLNGNTPSVNIEGLASGSYLIKIWGDNAGSTKMFIKE
jgi:Secretion system C-terminal sorting domain